MNGGWKRKVRGSASVAIATACLVALTGVAPGPIAALWTGSHASSGSPTVVFIAPGSGSSASGHRSEMRAHVGLAGHMGIDHRVPAGEHTRSASG